MVSKIFSFHGLFGELIQFWLIFFRWVGWNHQQALLTLTQRKTPPRWLSDARDAEQEAKRILEQSRLTQQVVQKLVGRFGDEGSPDCSLKAVKGSPPKKLIRKFRTWRSLKYIAHIDSIDEVGSHIVYKKCAYFSFLSNRQSEMSLAEGILKHGTHGMPWPGKRSFVWKTLDLWIFRCYPCFTFLTFFEFSFDFLMLCVTFNFSL